VNLCWCLLLASNFFRYQMYHVCRGKYLTVRSYTTKTSESARTMDYLAAAGREQCPWECLCGVSLKAKLSYAAAPQGLANVHRINAPGFQTWCWSPRTNGIQWRQGYASRPMPAEMRNLRLQHPICMSLMSRTMEAFRASKAISSWKRQFSMNHRQLYWNIGKWHLSTQACSTSSLLLNRSIWPRKNISATSSMDVFLRWYNGLKKGRPRNQRRRPEKRRWDMPRSVGHRKV
jgi:hypothetical protein